MNEDKKEKEGEWIYKHWCYFECSNCGFGIDKYDLKALLYPYCPMCGKKKKNYEVITRS